MTNRHSMILFFITVGWIVFMMPSTITSLVAYDCTHLMSNFSRVSIKSVKPCPDVKDIAVKTSKVDVQILQTQSWTNLHVYHCKINVIRTIHYCGMHSHTSLVHGGLTSYIQDISRDQCLDLHKTGSVYVEGTKITGIQSNTTQTTSSTVVGSTSMSGECAGGVYTTPEFSYTDVVVMITTEIHVKDYTASANQGDSTVRFNDGTTCGLKMRTCMHPVHGYTFWAYMEGSACTPTSVRVIYQGQAEVASGSGEVEIGAYISIESPDQLIGLRVVGVSHLCHEESFLTEASKIHVIARKSYGFFFQNRDYDNIRNLDSLLYTNAKISYLSHHITSQVTSLYRTLIRNDCELSKMSLENRISMARYHPYVIGNLINDDDGYLSVVGGDILYVAKCQAVDVVYRPSAKCFNNIPVTYNNESRYINPVGRIITPNSAEVPCSSLSPPTFELEGRWYTMSPRLSEVPSPDILEAQHALNNWTYYGIHDFLKKGLYTSEDLEQYQRFLSYPMQKMDANNYLAARVTRNNLFAGSSYSGLDLMSPIDMEHLGSEMASRVFWWMNWLGGYASIIVCIYMIVQITKYLLSVCVNVKAIHSVAGFGYHMVAALGTAFTYWFVQKKSRTNDINIKNDGDTVVDMHETGSVSNTQATELYPLVSEHEGVAQAYSHPIQTTYVEGTQAV